MPFNFLDNRIINGAERRLGNFGRVRGGELAGEARRANGDGGSEAGSEGGSNVTVLSDIPEEDGYCFANQSDIRFAYWNRFEDTQLFMKFIQWEKNSHGLFDYEMAKSKKKFLWTNKDKVVLREGLNIHFVDKEDYRKESYSANHQEIFRIEKQGRRFFIEGVQPTDIQKDIDDYYQENGEPMLPPKQMEERMFNVVKFLIVGNNEKSQDYQIKKNDLLKMGRIKFKVKAVVNKAQKSQKLKQADRRKHRLEEEKKVFKKELKERVQSGNNGSSLVNDGVAPDRLVFKSKYPKDYAKGPEHSIKSIHSPLMGELNFVHAKRPKYMKKNKSFCEQDEDQIKEKGAAADIEIDSVEI